ncbi:membrane protein insertase YidC [Streptococcus cuniculipharyngis]|uniref:Membrane protein insertase YidC n=1 Tax=Streptococcus cuniculipharyngis TaxID=1562651 RepID=A0A5C5SB87_9STRE|nr:membrane protein insertase YidC [Streptococcus cuniculipharyngis]TWS98147.1 membrane protein insertase YidC [Streptococcus cuniculipharyngis]
MKKRQKQLRLSGLGLSLLFLLAGCVQQKNGVPTGEGWVYKLLVEPMGKFIQYFANDMGLGFGIAIILVTIIVRLVILPLGLYQSWKASYQSEKMAYLKPILEPLQKQMQAASSQEEKLAAQTALLAAQRENGVSMLGGIGCMPLLIQIPFFSALFYAARFTEGIAGQSFLWFRLDQPDLPLVIIVGILYYVQSWLSMQGMQNASPEQAKQMQTMMYMTPLMMVMMSFSMPAGVTLYWFVGGIFSILQQLITMSILRPRLRQKVAEEFEKNPPKAYQSSKTRKDVTPKAQEALGARKPSNRNAGKQRRK